MRKFVEYQIHCTARWLTAPDPFENHDMHMNKDCRFDIFQFTQTH